MAIYLAVATAAPCSPRPAPPSTAPTRFVPVGHQALEQLFERLFCATVAVEGLELLAGLLFASL